MISKIALIARAILSIIDLVKRVILSSKVAKREKLVEDIKSGDTDKQLEALDKLRK